MKNRILGVAFYTLLSFGFFGCGGETTTLVLDHDQEIQEEGEEPAVSTTSISPSFFDGLIEQQWYLAKNDIFYQNNTIDSEAHIHPEATTYESYQGEGVKIAIIDDGFDTNHPEFKEQIRATSFVRRNGTVGSEVGHTFSYDHHGTAVTGIIASKNDGVGVRGIAPKSELILIKMGETLSDLAMKKLFEEAVKYGADVINCSWGTGEVSQLVKEYIEDISINGRGGKGVIVVFASGNDNTIPIGDESSIPSVIAVGATDGNNLRTEYSNYGPALDVVAPGGYQYGIATTDPLGDYGVSIDEYNRFDEARDGDLVSFIGTSAAAPIVSGALALLLEKHPDFTHAEVMERLKSATDTIGQNTPYLDDMIESFESRPTITGILGTNQYKDFQVQLIDQTTQILYGPFEITQGILNSWGSVVTVDLPNGTYKIELVDKDGGNIWATDEEFLIDTNLVANKQDTTVRRSDFYGYGKINLTKLLR